MPALAQLGSTARTIVVPIFAHVLVRTRRSCRLALQGGTHPLLNFNGLAETEIPLRAFQLRLRQAFWALKLRLIDGSIDRSISDRSISLAQRIPRIAMPFQSRPGAPESHMK